MPEPENILMETLTWTAARNVAAMLKRRGYTQATRENCKRSVIEIAYYFEPLDEERRDRLIKDIAKAAKLLP